MGYEVDFFPVTTGGAAIAVRWGQPGSYKILVYDGGTTASGHELVAHIATHCNSGWVDYVVSSHPGPRHAEGLGVVLEKLHIGELWMHRPWITSPQHSGRGAEATRRLERLARAHDIPIREPFEGAAIGPFTVLSPRQQWYAETLLPAFGMRLPRAAGLTLADASGWLRLAGAGLGGRWDYEPLPRVAATGAEDESSAVLYGEFEGRGVLLTGNAGIQALGRACAVAEEIGFDLPQNLRLAQIPNHGKPENLSSDLLDRIVGTRQPHARRCYTKSAFISVGRDMPPLGYKIVADALKRRGAMSFVTHALRLHHGHDMPERRWRPAGPVGMKA